MGPCFKVASNRLRDCFLEGLIAYLPVLSAFLILSTSPPFDSSQQPPGPPRSHPLWFWRREDKHTNPYCGRLTSLWPEWSGFSCLSCGFHSPGPHVTAFRHHSRSDKRDCCGWCVSRMCANLCLLSSFSSLSLSLVRGCCLWVYLHTCIFASCITNIIV